MKSISKRLFSTILAATMIATTMTGCGSTPESVITTPETNTSGADSTSKPSGEITIWMWENAKKSLDPLADEFKAAYPDIVVNYETMPNDDLYQKYVLTAQSGEGGPDVVVVESERLPMMIETQTLMNVKDIMGTDAANFNKGKISMATGSDGGIYAVPWDSAPSAMMYNRKLFKDAGLSDAPEDVAVMLATWDSYKETMTTINEKTGAFAFATQSTNVRPSHFAGMMGQKGETEDAFIFNKAGDVCFDSPFAVRVTQYLTDLFKEELIYDAQRYTQQHDEAYKADKVTTMFGGAWLTEVLKTAYGPENLGNWGVVPMPVWDAGDAPTAEDGGGNLAITANTDNFDAAWAYVSFHLMNTDSQAEMYKKGMFPAWEPTYGHPEVSVEDAFFGGQNAIAVFEDLAGKVPGVNYTKDYPRATEAIKVALELCYNDESKTVAEHMKTAADEVRAKTGRK